MSEYTIVTCGLYILIEYVVEGKWSEVTGIITADRNFFMPVMLEPSIMFLSIDWGDDFVQLPTKL